MILVPLLNPKFANAIAAPWCELRVRGTSAAAGILSRFDSALDPRREAAGTRPLGFLKHAGARLPAGSCRRGGAPVWYASECVHGHFNRPRPARRSGGAVLAHPHGRRP